MNNANHPSKERIRDWIYSRQIEPRPLPDMERIRTELGWNLVKCAHACMPARAPKS